MSRRLLDAKILVSATSDVTTCGGLWLYIPTCRRSRLYGHLAFRLLLEVLLWFHPHLLRRRHEAFTGGLFRPIRMEGYVLSRYPTTVADGTRQRCCGVRCAGPYFVAFPNLREALETNTTIRTQARSCTILPNFVGCVVSRPLPFCRAGLSWLPALCYSICESGVS
jgi:hypothetical protein